MPRHVDLAWALLWRSYEAKCRISRMYGRWRVDYWYGDQWYCDYHGYLCSALYSWFNYMVLGK